MHRITRLCSTDFVAGIVAVITAGLIVVPPVAPSLSHSQFRAIRLAGTGTGNTETGIGPELIIGASGVPTPSQAYIDFASKLYLQPLGFNGPSIEAVTTPESLYPFSGPRTLTINASGAGGRTDISTAVHEHIGEATPQNPIVFFGYSQGSWLLGQVQQELAADQVPSQDVHIVMVGDTGAPNGGLLQRFDVPNASEPTLPSLGLTFTSGQPSDLYPTNVYTLEYDGFADFPHYPIDVLSDLNALLGVVIEHLAYFGITTEQIHGADVVQLPTSDPGNLTDYYVIPQELPLLDPLRLIPFLGNPLADLLEPDTQVLVNLGYGSVTDGWDPGPADVQTPLAFLPSLSTMAGLLEQAPGALIIGLLQGITAAADDLENPQNYTQLIPTWVQQLLTASRAIILPSGSELARIQASSTSELTDATNALATADASLAAGTAPSGPWDFLGTAANDLANFLSSTFPTVHTGNPKIDTLEALVLTLPVYDLRIAVPELDAGNVLGAIGAPLAADLNFIPLATSLLLF